MPVLEAENKMKVLPDHVYFIPAGREAALENGILKIHPKTPSKQALSRFFSSLADNYGETTIGILLSKSTEEGIKGLKAIKAAGGLTFAEEGFSGAQSMKTGSHPFSRSGGDWEPPNKYGPAEWFLHVPQTYI